MPEEPLLLHQPLLPPAWVRTPADLRALARRLETAGMVGLDSESDSLHHFPEKVCLIQVGLGDGSVFLVDPLALEDLSLLGPLCADPSILKIFHGASYDLSSMKRDFDFAFTGVFDTMLAAQFLGLPELGLAALLENGFGIRPGRSSQKDDWAARPLTAAQEAYAAQDVRYLIPLQRWLVRQLQERGRLEWVEEECAALADIPAAERIFDPEDYLRVKGARDLDRRGLAVLRELFVAREEWARATGRPPFRVLGNEILLRLAAERPRTPEAMRGIRGCSATVLARWGDGILRAVGRGSALAEEALPVYPRLRRPTVPALVERRLAALTQWRAQAATRLELDPGVLLPRRLIERLAQQAPGDLDTLRALNGLREWRIRHFGSAILEVLGSAGPGAGGLAPKDSHPPGAHTADPPESKGEPER